MVRGLIEKLRSGSPELVVDALKEVERQAERGAEIGQVLPLIISMARNEDECVRYAAVKALSKARAAGAVPVLIYLIEHDRSEKVKEAAVKALGFIRPASYFDYVAGILGDYWEQSIRVRGAAAFALGHIDPEAAIPLLRTSVVNDPDADVRCEAAEALAFCLLKAEKEKAAEIAGTLISHIDSRAEENADVRKAVINTLIISGNPGCIDELIAVLQEDPDIRVRGEAANALSHFFDPRIESLLIEELKTEDDGLKKRIALALAKYAMRNPLGLHDETCRALIYIQKLYPRESYIWKEAIKALPAC